MRLNVIRNMSTLEINKIAKDLLQIFIQSIVHFYSKVEDHDKFNKIFIPDFRGYCTRIC